MTKRDAYLLRNYGITEKQYRQILKIQDGACAVCWKPPAPGKNLHVDHDHRPGGTVRGLLHWQCNRYLIGRWTDHRLFIRAALYLKHPPARRLGNLPPVPKRKRRKRQKARPRRRK